MKRVLFLSIIILFFCLVYLDAEEGLASWYGGKFQGRKTANGETFDTEKHTAAHKTMQFGTVVKVINLNNQKTTIVRINDRGPFVEGRIIDLSRIAAEEIGMVGTGIARVRIEVVELPQSGTHCVIQVASFKNRDNAVTLGEKLKEKGYLVSFEKTSAGYTRIHLEQVKKSALDETKKALKQMGYPNVIVRDMLPAK